MRDTFADTSAARRDLGFRSTVSLREGLAARVGMDPGARVRRSAASWLVALLGRGPAPAAASRTSRPSPATPTRSSGRPARRPPRRSSGRTRASTTAHHRRLPPERVRPGRAAGPGRQLLPGGRHRQLHPGGRRLPRVPDPLSLPPAERLRPVPGRGGLLPAAERARPGPDRHPEGPRGVPAAARPLPQLPAGGGGPRADHGAAARAWPAPSSWPATSTSAPARPAGRPSPATRASSTTIRTTSASTRCSSAWPSASALTGAASEAQPHLAPPPQAEYPTERVRRGGQASSSARRPRPPPAAASATPPVPRPAPAGPRDARRPVSSSVT